MKIDWYPSNGNSSYDVQMKRDFRHTDHDKGDRTPRRIESTMKLRNRLGWESALRAAPVIALVLIAGCGESSGGDVSEDTAQEVVSDADGEPSGSCQGLSNGSICDDGNTCTLNDSCSGGICVGGVNRTCDEEGQCRLGTCDPDDGCSYADEPPGTRCDIACYSRSMCQDGACVADTTSDTICPTPDNPCVAELGCDSNTGACTVEIYKPPATECNIDENICTMEECDGQGACLSTGDVETCESQNSNNPCWTYSCQHKSGCVQAVFVAGASCNDGNPCTYNDTCQVRATMAGDVQLCLGNPVPLDDDNPCTNDSCVDGTITHDPIDGIPCAPDDPCSEQGLCADGECVGADECPCSENSDCEQPESLCNGQRFCDKGVSPPVCRIVPGTATVCSPAIQPCHTSACNPLTGACQELPLVAGTPCDDRDACTDDDRCQSSGACSPGQPVVCDDGSFCNGVETCDAGEGCVAGDAPDASDAFACTADRCDEELDSIVHELRDDLCTDGLACNGIEICTADAGCVTEFVEAIDDGVDCTLDLCDDDNGTVVHEPSDGLCDDNNPCTDDSCNSASGCEHQNRDVGECDDNSTCTSGDACKQGACVGIPMICDDNNECTTDDCNPSNGLCRFANHPGECDDNNSCTDGDTCQGGSCVGEDIECEDDENPCTLERCVANGGCTFDFAGAEVPCGTNNLCNTGGHCEGGSCIFSTQKACNDLDACTDDSCDPTTGNCEYTDNLDVCDDATSCTREDFCLGGQCFGGQPRLRDRVFGDSGHDFATGVQIYSGGDVALAMTWQLGVAGEYRCRLFRLDDDLSTLWYADFGQDISGCLFVLNSDDTAFLLTKNAVGNRTQLVLLGENGETLWERPLSEAPAFTSVKSLTPGVQNSVHMLIKRGNVDYGIASISRDNVVGDEIEFIASGALGLHRWDSTFTIHSAGRVYRVESNGMYGILYSQSNPIYDLVMDDPSTMYLVGHAISHPRNNWVHKMNQYGELWTWMRDTPTIDAMVDALRHPGGGLVLVGNEQDTETGDLDVTMVRLDDYGRLVWKRTYGGFFADTADAVAALPDGGFVVAGATRSKGVGERDAWLIRTDAWGYANCLTAGGCFEISSATCDDNSLCSSDVCDASQGCQNTEIDDCCSELVPWCPPGFACTDDGTCESEAQVFVPGGSVSLMGCNEEIDLACNSDEYPRHEVLVAPFLIDTTEVTAAAYKECVEALICELPSTTSGGGATYNDEGLQMHPANFVTSAQARTFCTGSGRGDLCSEAQWEKAARGVDARTYPWGEAEASCAFAHMVAPNNVAGCGLESTAPVSGFPQGRSPYGVLNMSGNVSEWVKDSYHSTYLDAPTDGTSWGEAGEIVRGGALYDSAPVNLRASDRRRVSESTSSPSIGIRCCRQLQWP